MDLPEEYLAHPSLPLEHADEPHTSRDGDPPEDDEHRGERIFTDDPVRVYLREMGAVCLLKRQEEINLARRMERGNARMRKAFSRSPIVWAALVALLEEVRKDHAGIEGIVRSSGLDDDASDEQQREDVTRRLEEFARLRDCFLELARRIEHTPKHYRTWIMHAISVGGAGPACLMALAVE